MYRSHLGSSSVALSIGSSTHYGTALGRYPIAHGLTHVCSLAVHSSLLVSSLAVHHFGIWQPGCHLSPQLGSTAVNLRRGVAHRGDSPQAPCLQASGAYRPRVYGVSYCVQLAVRSSRQRPLTRGLWCCPCRQWKPAMVLQRPCLAGQGLLSVVRVGHQLCEHADCWC